VIATGEAYTVREFVEWSFAEVGISLKREWSGVDEKWYDLHTGKCLVHVDPSYFRPAEVDFLVGDASKAETKLGWKPKYTLKQMCAEMVQSDIILFKKQKILKDHGYEILQQYE
jgi:GDPmannose 4,6-dehydratase